MKAESTPVLLQIMLHACARSGRSSTHFDNLIFKGARGSSASKMEFNSAKTKKRPMTSR